jgi:MYXO-CTERM domain-containing protein
MRSPVRIHNPFLAIVSSAFVAFAALPASAVIIDATGDFLSVYDGPANGDLDVAQVDAILSEPGEVTLIGTHAAAIGTTPGATYVWGIDRGAGTEPFPTFSPPTGQGVFFDSVISLSPNGSGAFIDLALGGAPQPLASSAISIDGSTISVTLTESLLPSQGLDFADYRYNLWPRFAPEGLNPVDNTQISDFAPDASTFTASPLVTSVSEPASLVLVAGGVLAIAAMRRRRHPAV